MAKSSRIIRVAVADLPGHLPNGFVKIGMKDDDAYIHVASERDAVRIVNGTITDGVVAGERVLAEGESEPVGVPVLVIDEASVIPWPHVVVFDPTPEPFRWEAFAAVAPELCEPDADGVSVLTPHQWAGE